MTMLTIFYWILLLLILIGVLSPSSWAYWPRVNALAEFLLFVIIGLKLLRPAW